VSTLDQFRGCVQCGAELAQRWQAPMEAAMAEFGITTPRRIAAFLAQVGHESCSLARLEESLTYRTPERLMQVWPRRFPTLGSALPYVRNPEGLANLVYANRGGNGGPESGDGWRYRGRGPLQITFADGYRRAGQALGLPLVQQPGLLLAPEHGSRSAAWYFAAAGCLPLADAGDFDAVSDLVNLGRRTDRVGDAVGYSDRLARYRTALALLGT
jgi:putative chitinase